MMSVLRHLILLPLYNRTTVCTMKIPIAHQQHNFEPNHAKVENLTKREIQNVCCDTDKKKKSRMDLKNATVLSASQQSALLLKV